MRNHSFAYFIVSYGKAQEIPTLNTLRKLKHRYPVFIVIGTDDPQLDLYKKLYSDQLLIFDKADYIEAVDDLGLYAVTHKVCTYSRLAVYDFAVDMGVKYVGYLFDDIENMQLRYPLKTGKIASTKEFCIDDMVDIYIDLLDSSKDIYIVGPPISSFYMGVNLNSVSDYSTRFGNMLIYDVDKKLEPYKSSVLEDMSMVLYNNQVGKLSICPFGMQVKCRAPHTTTDSYGSMTELEYREHYAIITQTPINLHCPQIAYAKFTPKIIREECREERVEKHGKKRLI